MMKKNLLMLFVLGATTQVHGIFWSEPVQPAAPGGPIMNARRRTYNIKNLEREAYRTTRALHVKTLTLKDLEERRDTATTFLVGMREHHTKLCQQFPLYSRTKSQQEIIDGSQSLLQRAEQEWKKSNNEYLEHKRQYLP